MRAAVQPDRKAGPDSRALGIPGALAGGTLASARGLLGTDMSDRLKTDVSGIDASIGGAALDSVTPRSYVCIYTHTYTYPYIYTCIHTYTHILHQRLHLYVTCVMLDVIHLHIMCYICMHLY